MVDIVVGATENPANTGSVLFINLEAVLESAQAEQEPHFKAIIGDVTVGTEST